jgi:hypothetical protein
MRRYGVRILIAVLTFGLGVALSFVLGAVGIFGVRHTTKPHNWGRRDCPKKFRNQVLVPVAISNQPNAPLRLVDLGPSFDTRSSTEHLIRVRVENQSSSTITGFILRGETVWASSGANTGKLEDVTNGVLRPGESRVVYLLNDNEMAVTLGVSQVQFLDGSTWNSPYQIQ